MIPSPRSRRRTFLLGAAAMMSRPPAAVAMDTDSPSDRPRIGVIGCGSRWGWQLAGGGRYGVGPDFAKFADTVAVCDCDRRRREAGGELVRGWQGQMPTVMADYRDIIDRDDIDAVAIFTPDHWHAKIAAEAMNSGKAVYCEKPLTLTIQEGQLLCDIASSTGRVIGVGTQQRSLRGFQTAVALVRGGRLGDVRRITCGVGGAPNSPALPVASPPPTLDWDRWLGPAPDAEFRFLAGAANETKSWSRCHYEFRWWYEYSGGKLTDWGAHHVDIATWILDKQSTGPTSIQPISVEHPTAMRDGMPVSKDRYNTATRFKIRVVYGDDRELIIDSEARNGLLVEGSRGRLFVNRRTLSGRPVEGLKNDPLDESTLASVSADLLRDDADSKSGSVAHVRNFFESLRSGRRPNSNVWTHHRSLSTCHLATIAARLNRSIRFDPERQTILDDSLAQSMLSRPKRRGYEIEI